jgi:hypothetical protein
MKPNCYYQHTVFTTLFCFCRSQLSIFWHILHLTKMTTQGRSRPITLLFFTLTLTFLQAEAVAPSSNFRFARDNVLDGMMFVNNILFDQGTVRSRLECAKICGKTPGCLTFTLHGGGGCRGHNTVMTAISASVFAKGARTFVTGKVDDQHNINIKSFATGIIST